MGSENRDQSWDSDDDQSGDEDEATGFLQIIEGKKRSTTHSILSFLGKRGRGEENE